jgi:hypothetical protein
MIETQKNNLTEGKKENINKNGDCKKTGRDRHKEIT